MPTFNYANINTDEKFLVIAGPCVVESEEMTMRIAAKIAELNEKIDDAKFVFKASFDKANRTSVSSYRGPGRDEGLKILEKAKKETGLPVITDIHVPSEAKPVSEVVDILQIPAFLSRQTDMLRAACETGKAVNVKKAQFMAGTDMEHVAKKCSDASEEKRLLFTERGTSFGYHNLVVDMRNLVIMRKHAPVIFDATHSVQLPSAAGGVSGGGKEFIPNLLFAAVGAGIDGVFMEVHPEPAKGLSDAATMFELDKLEDLLRKALKIREARS